MTCKDDVDNWMSKLPTSSNIKYNMESGGPSRTGKRVPFTRWYIIMPVQTEKLMTSMRLTFNASLKQNRGF